VNWIVDNLDLIWRLTLDHVRLSIPPIVLGLLLSIPLGWVAYRYKLTRGLLLTVTGLLYTIPSLALLVLLPSVIGISFFSELNITIGLTIYAVALLARSVADALGSVDPGVRQSATAMGYSSWRRFWQVELPLAGPVILAGLRVAAVSTVSLVTVGIVVGIESLGYLFTNGLDRGILAEIFAGVVMTMVVALVFDRVIALVGRLVMPWASSRTTRKAGRRAARTASQAGVAR
jgi:osmoprotectant transport system permease protein